jgi:hypothetical protein
MYSSERRKIKTPVLRCPFAKNCWMPIGVSIPSWLRPERATRRIKRSLGLPFAMDIIMIMCWSIWKEMNSWFFSNIAPCVANCKTTFNREFAWVVHRTKKGYKSDLEVWLNSVN